MSTPPPEMTPLHELAALWMRQQVDYPISAAGEAARAAVVLCARELDAALAAASGPHEAGVTDLLLASGVSPNDRYIWSHLMNRLPQFVASVEAAARAQGWRTCPVTGSAHEWRGWEHTSYIGALPYCSVCGVRRSAVEPPPRPEQGGAKR